MSLFNYFKKVPKSNISNQNSSGNISSGSRGKPGERFPPPPKPGKLVKDGEQFTPQSAMRIDIRKISLNLSKFLLNFLKYFQKFLKNTFKNFN